MDCGGRTWPWAGLRAGNIPALLRVGCPVPPVAVMADVSAVYGESGPLLVDLKEIPGRGVRVSGDWLGGILAALQGLGAPGLSTAVPRGAVAAMVCNVEINHLDFCDSVAIGDPEVFWGRASEVRVLFGIRQDARGRVLLPAGGLGHRADGELAGRSIAGGSRRVRRRWTAGQSALSARSSARPGPAPRRRAAPNSSPAAASG